MASSEKKCVSECSEAYILRQQGFKVQAVITIMGESNNIMMKLSESGEKNDFSRKMESGRPNTMSSKSLNYKSGRATKQLTRIRKDKKTNISKSTVHKCMEKYLV